ncbi:MAG: rhomboid family intramembrane serine protease [Saprospiraceae bacterium]
MSLTLVIVIVTCLISYAATNDYGLFEKLKHNPYQEVRNKEYYRLLTAGFVHDNRSWTHLLINMFVMWQFGEAVENQFVNIFGEMTGRLNFLLMYLFTIVAANTVTMFLHKDNPRFSSVGASGGVSGIIFTFVIFYPWAMLLLFFVIPCPAIIAAVLYLFYSQYSAKQGGGNIDHVAHFYGAVFGFLFTILLKPELLGVFWSNLINNMPF